MAHASPAVPTAGAPSHQSAGDCLKIETFDSSILSANDVFTDQSRVQPSKLGIKGTSCLMFKSIDRMPEIQVQLVSRFLI